MKQKKLAKVSKLVAYKTRAWEFIYLQNIRGCISDEICNRLLRMVDNLRTVREVETFTDTAFFLTFNRQQETGL